MSEVGSVRERVTTTALTAVFHLVVGLALAGYFLATGVHATTRRAGAAVRRLLTRSRHVPHGR